MNEDIKLEIIDNKKIRATKILQTFVKRINVKNLKLRNSIKKIIYSQDTIKIIPGKFDLPLYMVQQTIYKKIFGENNWNKFQHILENSCIIEISFILWFFGISYSYVYITGYYTNIYLNIISTILTLPIYIIYIVCLLEQLLLLVFSTLECKIYLIMTILMAIGLSDMFRDFRILNVWSTLFFGTMIMPIADALPKYLKKLRNILSLLSLVFITYFTIIGISIIIGKIPVVSREFTIILLKNDTYTEYNHTNITHTFCPQKNKDIVSTLSSVSYTLSLMQTISVLMIKNIYWFIRNRERAIVLKSPVLIQQLDNYNHSYKKTCSKKSYMQQQFTINKHSANKITLQSNFPLFHSY